MVMWHMSDRSIPRSYRMMEGLVLILIALSMPKEKPTLLNFIGNLYLG